MCVRVREREHIERREVESCLCVCERETEVYIYMLSNIYMRIPKKKSILPTTKHWKKTFLNWGEGSAQQLTSFALLVTIVIGYHKTHVVMAMREGFYWMQIHKAVLREAPKPVLRLC